MSQRRRKGEHLHRGPFTYADLHKAISLDGWQRIKKGRHLRYRHATRPGTIRLDDKWTGVKPGHNVFRGVMAQGDYTKDELLKLLNGFRLG